MNYTLLASALLMGLAGSPHCLAMCGAASAAAVRLCGPGRHLSPWWGFHLGRAVGYAAAGALAATSVGALAVLGQWSPALRPLWVLAHMAGLGLGLYLLWQGRQPPWLEQLGRQGQRANAQGMASVQVVHPRMAGWRALGAGALWFAWPCGLLQSALLVASLANGPAQGAAIMVTFAAGSALALGAVPALWMRWIGGDAQRHGAWMVAMVRWSGAALAGASLWALGHDVFVRFAAWCLS